MTTKLLNFKTFLSKAPYQPIGIKPCPKPGEHRHWGRMDCHPMQQKHKKHLKMGIDLHHGMDPSTGQIPEGIVPPNAHESYDDSHHLAKPHGEHTGGGAAGNCKSGTYKGKTAPFHRHHGADYCHAVEQKHGSSSPGKAIAQQWHDTHQAQIQESWYLFNESEGIAQEEATADPLYEGGTQPQTTAEDVTLMPPLEGESSGSVDNPHNAGVEDVIKLKVDYVDSHPAKTYKITGIGEATSGEFFAELEHTETGKKSGIDLSDPNIEGIEDKWQPEGPAVSSENPHEFQIGSVFKSNDNMYKITGIDIEENQIYYTVTDKNGEYPEDLNYQLDNFNEWVTSSLVTGGTVEHPATLPPIIEVGDTITSANSEGLKVGDKLNWLTPSGNIAMIGVISALSESGEITTDWTGVEGSTSEGTTFIDTMGPDAWKGEGVLKDGLIEFAQEEVVTTPAKSTSPTLIGQNLSSHDQLAELTPGTVIGNSNTGVLLTILDNSPDPGSYHGGMIKYQEEGLIPSSMSYEALINLEDGYEVTSLSAKDSSVANTGFQLGGKVNSDNFLSLPAGLSFLAANGSTITVLDKTVPTGEKPGIYVNIETKDGAVFSNQLISEISETSLGWSGAADKGLKIVGLPDGTVVQHVPEPTEITPINKHGLDKGTTVTVQNAAGTSSSAKIIKTHKTKAGQNYTLEYTDGPYEGTTTKVTSDANFQGSGDEIDGVGIIIDEPVYKPGQEPTDDVELTLPPLGSEPGNWDEVLEQTGGKLGYNDGGQFTHKQTGDEFYIKFSSSGSAQQVKSEDLANTLYELVGVPTLGTNLVSFQGKTALKSSWDPALSPITLNDMANESDIMDNFVIDAWLANWDVIGPDHNNTQKSGNKVIKVDSGGALGFHGAGSAKAFPDDVPELESMRDPSTAKVASKVFGKVSEANLIAGTQKLAKVTDAQIDAIVNASKITNKAKMAATLKARRDYVVQKILSKDLKQGSEWTDSIGKPGQHKHAGYNGWHSETLAHPASNKAASNAHKTLGLSFQEPALGPTSTPETKFWGRLSTSDNSPQMKELAQKALSYDFKAGGNAYESATAIKKFFDENNIKDTFIADFSSWQGGSSMYPRIKINAALAKLRSPDATTLAQTKNSENGYWVQTRGATDFSNAWEAGINESMALIPYIAASQQGIKSKTTKANPDTLPTVYRGLRGDITQTYKKAVAAEQSANVKRVHMQGGLQGFSLSKGTSYSFAKGAGVGKGVVFHKKKVPIDDVLLYFPTWEASYAGESEMALDPSAIEEFSLDEVNFV